MRIDLTVASGLNCGSFRVTTISVAFIAGVFTARSSFVVRKESRVPSRFGLMATVPSLKSCTSGASSSVIKIVVDAAADSQDALALRIEKVLDTVSGIKDLDRSDLLPVQLNFHHALSFTVNQP